MLLDDFKQKNHSYIDGDVLQPRGKKLQVILQTKEKSKKTEK